MGIRTEDAGKPLLWKDKCKAGSPNGNFCGLMKDHEGPHHKKAGRTESGELWDDNWDQSGVALIKAVNKYTNSNIILTPDLSRLWGNIFDEATENMDYSFCGDCEYKRDC